MTGEHQMGRRSTAQPVTDNHDPMVRFAACKAMARGLAETRTKATDRLKLARAFAAEVIVGYWTTMVQQHGGANWAVKAVPSGNGRLSAEAKRVAADVGSLVTEFPIMDAGYLIGSVYTAMIPDDMRASQGAYYTPPPLVERLIDQAERAGWDPAKHNTIDPACGGGAFLAPLALRMWQKAKKAPPEWTLASIASRLRGIEIDPFAAWISEVLLEAALLPLCLAAKRRMPDVVTVADSMTQDEIGQFDLVIGNPPYGKLTLPAEMRAKYKRSLYGHANLYGVFYDLALRLAKPKTGVVAYLTPTSWLGGAYFTALRSTVAALATPVGMDFVSDRDGVFDGVLQETMLAAFVMGRHRRNLDVSLIIPKGLEESAVEAVGTATITKDGSPWLIARRAEDAPFVAKLRSMPTRLADVGLFVSTGQLVWNRHKGQLRQTKGRGTLPLIWAEAITANGFRHQATQRNHVPHFAILPGQDTLITTQTCAMVQRTTAKEQDRRLLSAVLPQDFLDAYGGAVVENHVNLVCGEDALIIPETVAMLLNSGSADRAFRCISGSVAVSAYELEALPLPTVEQLLELDSAVREKASKIKIEKLIVKFYGG